MAARDRRRLRGLLATSLVMGAAALLFSGGRRTPHAALAGDEAGPSREAVDDGFEPRDVQTRSIAIAMLISVTVIAVSVAGLVVMLQVMHARDALAPPLTAQQTAPIVPPGPPLQSDPLGDIAVLRQQESAALATYRWLGPDHAAAQIPIDRAMVIVVGRPLDPPPPEATAPQPGSNP